jgi:hypothetical protein
LSKVKAVLNPARITDHFETHWLGMDCIAVPGLLGKLDAIIRCQANQ